LMYIKKRGGVPKLSPLGRKLNQISVEIFIDRPFLIRSRHLLFPGLFYHQNYEVHCFP
jgi:hypothetical protein